MGSRIRLATPADSEAILRIYSPYITDTAITFETEIPSIEAFAERIEGIVKRYPFLVYETDGKVVGYAYASRYKERLAYRFDVELSIYLDDSVHGKGIAKALYDRLLTLLGALGYVNAYSLCTVPNDKSYRFHEKEGFRLMCIHRETGYKLGAWRDVAWFEKPINHHADSPAEPLPITALAPRYIEEVLALS